jgi:hypothetical protein
VKVLLPEDGVLVVVGRLTGVCDFGAPNVFVEARKSVGIYFSLLELEVGLELKDRNVEPLEESLEPGLEEGCIGLSGLKKFESRLRIAGEAGMFCKVSIVLFYELAKSAEVSRNFFGI